MVPPYELNQSDLRSSQCAALMLLAWLALALGPQVAAGQELEARAYAPNPVGARFLVGTWSHSDGDVLLDASAPIQDFEIAQTPTPQASVGPLRSGTGWRARRSSCRTSTPRLPAW